MKIVHKYVIKSFILPLIATFFVCVFILLMQFLWKYIDDLVGKGLEWNIIAELLFYAALVLVPMALPLAVLLASIMTFGNLGESNELFAMKSGGISLYKIMSPVFVVAILISIASFLFSNNILPYTNLKMRSLLMSIQQQRPEISIQNGIFSEPVEYFSIKADKEKKSGVLNNILIYDHRKSSSNSNVTTAESGTFKITEDKSFFILDLKNGHQYEEVQSKDNNNGQQFQRTSFKHQRSYIQLDNIGLDRNNEDFFKDNYEMLNNQQLIQNVDSLKNNLNTYLYNTSKNTFTYYAMKFLPKKETILIDSIPPVKITEHKYYKFDSIFNSLTEEQKKDVYNKLLNDARSTKINFEIANDERNSSLRYIARHEIEWHRKYTFASACLIFFIIGTSLGAIIRKGGFGVPVIISISFFLFYYIISIAFENAVRELVISSLFGMWMSTFILIPIALILAVKATNETLGFAAISKKLIIKFKRKKSEIK